MENSWGYEGNGASNGRQRYGGFGGQSRGGRGGGGGGGGWRQQDDWEDRGSRQWGRQDGGSGRGGGGSGGSMGGGDAVTMSVSRTYVGRIIGKRGAKIKELEACSGARIKVLNSDSNAPEATIELRGSPSTIQTAEEMINELINSSDFGSEGGFGGGRGYSGGRGGGGGFSGGASRGGGGGWGGPQEGDETTTIQVGNENLGRIIGKGGSKIKELQMRSGCRIKVMSQESGPTETPIELTGNPAATRRAEEMIQELISVY